VTSTSADALMKMKTSHCHLPAQALASLTGNAVSWSMDITTWMTIDRIRKNLFSPKSLFSSLAGYEYIKNESLYLGRLAGSVRRAYDS